MSASNYVYLTPQGTVLPDTSSTYATTQSWWTQAFGADIITTPDTPQGVIAVGDALALDAVLSGAAAVFRVRPVPKFPVVKRDLAIVVDEKIRVADLENLMRDNAAPHLRDVVLFDQYLGINSNQLFALPIAFVELPNQDRGSIRNLFARESEDFFADEFRRQKSFAPIGDLVRTVGCLSIWDVFKHFFQQ